MNGYEKRARAHGPAVDDLAENRAISGLVDDLRTA